jgi:hypothetical protein
MVNISLNGYQLNCQSYQIDKKAKYYPFPVPNTNTNPIITQGAYNTTYTVQATAINDIDIENIVTLLNADYTLSLLDVEGNTNSVAVTGWNIEEDAGRVGIYLLNMTFIDVAK